jgi:hypothetical protein
MTNDDEDLALLVVVLDAAVPELGAVREGVGAAMTASLSSEEQVTLLAGLLERARAVRRDVDAVCAGLGGAALDRGAPPRMLDWADGRDVD